MTIFLTNSISKVKEEFIPINKNHIKMYVCGPTVYDRPHLGNARSTVVFDVLYRLLKQVYPQVTYVRNITDVDDKIIAAAINNNEEINSLTARTTKCYHDDMNAISCLSPTIEPKATEHIHEMIKMIEVLIKQGHAYLVDGHVLFNIESFENYGKLSRRSLDEMIAGARVEVAPFKKHPADFVLWKPAKENESQCSFNSPWGKGRPGWHIECSAMSKKHLGEEFDIHGGGVDLTFPHHENELAQSVCANENKEFVKYWIHNGFLTINGEKMSKSLGNFKTVRDILNEGVDGSTLRYFYLTTHYRKPLDFTKKAIDDAQKAIQRFKNATNNLSNSDLGQFCHDEILQALKDDLNTPLALAKLHEYADLAFKGSKDAAKSLLQGAYFLGIDLLSAEKVDIPDNIMRLANERMEAKNQKDWVKADNLRQQIQKLGYLIKDTKDSYTIYRK